METWRGLTEESEVEIGGGGGVASRVDFDIACCAMLSARGRE